MSSRFSELLENLKDMFPQYYMITVSMLTSHNCELTATKANTSLEYKNTFKINDIEKQTDEM